jgi:DNA-directed RNA polymerase subunit L
MGANFFGDSSVAKIMDGASQFFPQFAQTTKTFMQSYSIPHELAKNMIVNIKLPQANEKMRNYGESLKEANQHLEQLMQLMKQAKTKINQG